MAGMRTKLNVLATHVGIFRGISANFSGDGFSDMNFDVRVGTQADFNQWVKSVQTSTLSLNDQTYQGLITPSEKLPITYYKDNDTGLFDNIIMKDMMPMSQNNNTQQ
jgi:cytochrome o ubiquinol oxidase subunit 2